MRKFVISASFLSLSFGLHSPLFAQANANATAGAGDAFGFRSGDDAVGIYDESSVRGFNLEAAGNYRLNGGYFVKNSGVSSFFLESTTVRIGYNTLNTILPGPSGVVDFRLRDPAANEPNSITAGWDVYAQPYLDIHLKGRGTAGRSSYSIGLGVVPEIHDQQGGKGGGSILLAGTGRLDLPFGTFRVFAGEYQYKRFGQFRVAAQGEALPPRIGRGRFLGQPWAFEEGQRRIAGALLDAPLGKGIGIGTTAVFSQEDPTRAYTQIFRDLQPDGSARAVVIATPQQRSTAWSGEVRAHAELPSENIRQRLDLTLRGRSSRARFGRSQIVDLGRAQFGQRPIEQTAPSLSGEGALRDKVDQFGIGLTYRATVHETIRINLGALKTDYRKTFVGVDGKPQPSSSSPWLYNLGASWRVASKLELYGSYSRGLEEAGIAPATASNRNEVLNAIQVTQREVGARYTPTGTTALVLAGFDTRKPYAGIDNASGAYRFLGEVRHRGIEASFSGRVATGTSVVIGGVLLDPELSGTEIRAGRFGRRPVGVPRLRAVASIDYAWPHAPGLSLDAAVTFVGERPARSTLMSGGNDQLNVEALASVNLGARYKFKIADQNLIARAQVLNFFDRYAWEVNNSETLNYSPPRRFKIVLTGLF